MKHSIRWMDWEGRICWAHTDDAYCAQSAARALSRAYTEATIHQGNTEIKYRHGEQTSTKSA